MAYSPYEFGYAEGRDDYTYEEFKDTPYEDYEDYYRRRRRPVKAPRVSDIHWQSNFELCDIL